MPTAYCYHGYGNRKLDCWADSNGCAAGNTLESAILQGFMELVERDCVALWWYNRLQKPRLDLDSFDEPYFSALKKHYQASDRELWVLDITSDLNIPAFAAISRRSDRQVEDIVLGFGAHFDPCLDRVIEAIGCDRLLFGSDYPHVHWGRQEEKPDNLDIKQALVEQLSQSTVSKILWDNPARFYGID